MKIFARLSLALILATLVPATSRAGAPAAATEGKGAPSPTTDGWWFRMAPYGWVTATEGDMGVRGLTAPVDISFADTIDSLDLAFMGVAEVGKGRWGVGLDVVYGAFSEGTNLNGPIVRSVDVEQTQVLLSPRISYRLIDRPNYRMDLMAGARWTYLDLDFEVRGERGGKIRLGGSEDWVDPVVGVRGRWDFAERWFAQYMGEVGGFGASSDLVWQGYLGVGYRISDGVSVGVGYRGLGVDYSEGGVKVDTVAHGPLIGIEFAF